MTLADRVRGHVDWPSYCRALELSRGPHSAETVSVASDTARRYARRIAAELGLSPAEAHQLPQIARRNKPRGRPRKQPERFRVCCPHCSATFEAEP